MPKSKEPKSPTPKFTLRQVTAKIFSPSRGPKLLKLSLGSGIVLALQYFSFSSKPAEPAIPQIQGVSQSSPSPTPTPSPQTTSQIPAPSLTAKGAIVYDLDSDTTLYSKNPDIPLLPASTTKIMTALIALETYDLDQIITITEEERTIGQTMNLVRGETISVKNLLAGTLVASGNDAALALALAYPGGGYSGFLTAMNQRAQNLGLTNTNFTNVSGVESANHYSSVRDLAILADHALANSVFSGLASTQETTVHSNDGRFSHRLRNTNELLGKVEGVTGVKTGWTENALECLVTSVDRAGRRIIVVILGSNDRFGESQRLIDWAYANHQWPQSR